MVELHTCLTPKINEQLVFNLKIVYSTLVEITDKEMDDETRKYLLTVVVPQASTDIRPFDNHEVSFDKDEDNDDSFAFLKFLEENEKDEVSQ